MPRIRNASGKDFVSKDKDKLGWDQGSVKLETSLVPSEHAVTLCKIST